MKPILDFWKKDLINKMIMLVSLALVLGFIFIAYTLLATPQGTIVYDSLLQKDSGIPTIVPVRASATPVFTPTTALFPSTMVLQPSGLTATGSKVPTRLPRTATSTGFSFPSATLPSSLISASACIPENPRQSGKVLGVIDGNTIRVYTDKLVYVVRYIGIEVPKYDGVKEPYGDAAMFKNSNLVFGKQVSLIRDVSDKDSVGRLLRYVLVGDTFVNLELARTGFATAVIVAPDTACSQALKDAEQAARQAQVGRWSPTATHTSP